MPVLNFYPEVCELDTLNQIIVYLLFTSKVAHYSASCANPHVCLFV